MAVLTPNDKGCKRSSVGECSSATQFDLTEVVKHVAIKHEYAPPMASSRYRVYGRDTRRRNGERW